jgi:hypothetical protein
MLEETRHPVIRFFGGFWKGLDEARRIFVNLLFLALIIAAFADEVLMNPDGLLILEGYGR